MVGITYGPAKPYMAIVVTTVATMETLAIQISLKRETGWISISVYTLATQ